MALLTAMEFWLEAVDDGRFAGALLLDLFRAFDCVPHNLLLQELYSVGAEIGSLQWFSSYLTGRMQRVYFKDVATEWLPISRGVPQGSCLSPLLFNIFVRNMPASSESECVQFADDFTGLAADESLRGIARKLVSTFEKTKQFCHSHGLVVNETKTQFIEFKTRNSKISD